MTHDEIIRALDVADGPVWTHSIFDSLFDALKWRPINEIPKDFEGMVELAGPDGYRNVAFTYHLNGVQIWNHCEDATQVEQATHWRPVLPGPVEE